MLMFKDTLFNIYCGFMNIKPTANSTGAYAGMKFT